MRSILFAGLALASVPVSLTLAAETQLEAVLLPEGSVPAVEGLAAWDRIHEVLSHPRCLNCHVGPEGIPLWTEDPDAPERPHGMFIAAGKSRIGAEHLPCSACHITSAAPNLVLNGAPHAGIDWQLAPVEFQWTGKTSAEICAQMRDPARNGGRDYAGLIEHITHDYELGGFITWGFEPGPERQPAPYDIQTHLNDFLAWGAAGMPCAEDE